MIKMTNPRNLMLLLIMSITLSACGGGGGGGSSSSGDDREPTATFTVQASAVPSGTGTIAGTGEYDQGSTFTLEATPNEGYFFVEWRENDASVSTETTLEADATEDRIFTAHFVEKDIEELKVSPENSQAPLYTDIEFQAQAVYTDGSSQDVTQSVTWKSEDTSLATFDAESPNTLSSNAEGTVTITATIGEISAATTVTISSPELLSLTLSEENLTLSLGETDSISASGNYRGDVTIDVTDKVSWISANEGIATVGTQESNAGTISSVAAGSTTITASLDGVSADATVTVDAAALTSIAISSNNTSILEGSITQLSATAHYTDGSSKEVTEQVTWSSSDSSVASVSATGLVSALSVGSATITAQLGELGSETILDIVSAPNNPGTLTLQGVPNVILDDGSDSTRITATVLPNDGTNGVIADGTVVTFTPDSNSLALDSLQGATVGGEANTEASSVTTGQYEVIAEVPDTTAIDQAIIRVVSSFSSVISTSSSTSLININGYFQPGSRFTTTITNTSNRPFNIHEVTFMNGTDIIVSSTDPSDLGGGTLEAGESLGVTVELTNPQPDNGFIMEFDLSDTPTGRQFSATNAF